MTSIEGIAMAIVLLFIYNFSVGPDVVGLAVATLCLWHGIWRLLDHFEIVFRVEDKPLISAAASIGAGAALAFCMHRFRVDDSMTYLEGRF